MVQLPLDSTRIGQPLPGCVRCGRGAFRRFAGREADPVRVVTRLPAASPELQAWTGRVEQLSQVRSVRSPVALSDGVTSVEVVPTGTRQGDAAMDLVRALRTDRPSGDALVTPR